MSRSAPGIWAVWSSRLDLKHSNRLRLLLLLLLFDMLLIAAVLLSFQEAELIDQVIQYEQTREIYATRIIEQVYTETTIITQIIPYGSLP